MKTNKYRWYLSASAVRDYMRIAGIAGDDDGPEFFQAEAELGALCATARLRREAGPGRLDFRVNTRIRGRRTRLDFVVMVGHRPEGDLGQLVTVRAEVR